MMILDMSFSGRQLRILVIFLVLFPSVDDS